MWWGLQYPHSWISLQAERQSHPAESKTDDQLRKQLWTGRKQKGSHWKLRVVQSRTLITSSTNYALHQPLLAWPEHYRFSNKMCYINLRFTYLHTYHTTGRILFLWLICLHVCLLAKKLQLDFNTWKLCYGKETIWCLCYLLHPYSTGNFTMIPLEQINSSLPSGCEDPKLILCNYILKIHCTQTLQTLGWSGELSRQCSNLCKIHMKTATHSKSVNTSLCLPCF